MTAIWEPTTSTSPYAKGDIPLGGLVVLNERGFITDLKARNNPLRKKDYTHGRGKDIDLLIGGDYEHGLKVSTSKSLSRFKLAFVQKPKIRLVAPQTSLYRLRQPGAVFTSLLDRKWMARWLEERNHNENQDTICFVIGYRTFTDAKLYAYKEDEITTSTNSLNNPKASTKEQKRRLPSSSKGFRNDLANRDSAGDPQKQQRMAREHIFAICYWKMTVDFRRGNGRVRGWSDGKIIWRIVRFADL